MLLIYTYILIVPRNDDGDKVYLLYPTVIDILLYKAILLSSSGETVDEVEDIPVKKSAPVRVTLF